jgi:4-hydroxy-tetrahydrodipicolinate synthase
VSEKGLARGLWGVVATPFRGPGAAVDEESLAGLVQRYEAMGAVGLTVLGVFGEAASLDEAERRTVLRTVRDAVRLPLVVGVTSLATAPACAEIAVMQDVLGDRLAAAMVQINSGSPGTVAAHFTAVHRQTGASVVMQNYPVASGVSIAIGDECSVVENAEGLVAVKEEAAPTAARIAALRTRTDLPVFGGLGGIGLIDELEVGAAGAMTGFSYPEALIATVQSHAGNGFGGARETLAPYLPLINFEQQPGIALAIRKACLVRRGFIQEATVRAPARPLPPELSQLVAAHVDAVERLRSELG